MKINLMRRLVYIVISICYLALIQIWWVLGARSRQVYCTFLVFHSIPTDKVAKFREHIRTIRKLTCPIALNGKTLVSNQKRHSIICFDDSFQSVINFAVPELRKWKLPFALFIPVGQLGERPSWLRGTGHQDEGEKVASGAELRALPAELVTFGSHTVNHHRLKLLNKEEACAEIRKSKNILEAEVGREVVYLAYPYNSYNSKIGEWCLKHGYRQTFSSLPESPIAPMDKFVKGRTEVSFADWKIEVILKVLGGYGWIASARRAMRKLNRLLEI